MADITPVTREEFYLAKAGGQDVPVPSAVTREEHYLEKLSNDSVVVPSPVTRREKFLYFACGGEIDLPSEERMTRLERLIVKAGGMDVSTPTAVTRLEKFWANVEGGGWKVTELTGTLPITFRSNGTALINYRIYGTSEGAGERTKNLLDITAYNRSAPSVRVNGISAVRGYVSATGNGEVNWEKIFWRPPLEYGKTYILSLNVVSSTSAHYMAISDVGGTVVYNLALRTTGQKTLVINYTQSSFPNGIKLDTVLTGGNAPTDPSTLVMSDMMLVEGSTAPATFILYGYQIPLTVSQQGQPDKTVDIYIGDTKLLSTDYIDYETGKVVRNGTPQDPPLPLPAIETFSGTNTLDSTETLGEVTIKGKIKEA